MTWTAKTCREAAYHLAETGIRFAATDLANSAIDEEEICDDCGDPNCDGMVPFGDFDEWSEDITRRLRLTASARSYDFTGGIEALADFDPAGDLVLDMIAYCDHACCDGIRQIRVTSVADEELEHYLSHQVNTSLGVTALATLLTTVMLAGTMSLLFGWASLGISIFMIIAGAAGLPLAGRVLNIISDRLPSSVFGINDTQSGVCEEGTWPRGEEPGALAA